MIPCTAEPKRLAWAQVIRREGVMDPTTLKTMWTVRGSHYYPVLVHGFGIEVGEAGQEAFYYCVVEDLQGRIQTHDMQKIQFIGEHPWQPQKEK